MNTVKVDYNKKMKEVINLLDENKKPHILLHSCCAPCSTSVIERLIKHFIITIYYYNPNIYPNSEFIKRRNAQIKYIRKLQNEGIDINFLTEKYKYNDFKNHIKSLEEDNERGKRCYECYYLRLEKTAQKAKNGGFDYFCTTLSISPYKNAEWINEIGNSMSDKYGIKYLSSDFKKDEGYKRSIILSRAENLYRQDYCGCKFSNLLFVRQKEAKNLGVAIPPNP